MCGNYIILYSTMICSNTVSSQIINLSTLAGNMTSARNTFLSQVAHAATWVKSQVAPQDFSLPHFYVISFFFQISYSYTLFFRTRY